MKVSSFFNWFFFKCLWMGLFLWLLWNLIPSFGQLNPFRLAEDMSTSAELMQIEAALEQHYLLNDRYPDDFSEFLEENFHSKLKKVTLDSWGTPYRFARQGERYVIRSAGPDRAFDNADDVFLLHEARPVSSGQSGLDWVLA